MFYLLNASYKFFAGCGDFSISDLTFLPDPCPLPEQEKKRSLDQRERLIYAPMAGVGGIVYDKDAVYIELGGSHSHNKKKSDSKPKNELMEQLVKTQYTLKEKMEQTGLRMFRESEPINSTARM